MSNIQIVATWLFFILIACVPCTAQETRPPDSSVDGRPPDALTVGSRLRLSAPSFSDRRLIGTLREWNTDALSLKTRTNALQTIPHTAIEKLEISQGRNPRRTLTATGIGFLIGTAVGVLGQRWACSWSESDCDITVSKTIGIGVLGAIPGGVIGAILGREKWREVALR